MLFKFMHKNTRALPVRSFRSLTLILTSLTLLSSFLFLSLTTQARPTDNDNDANEVQVVDATAVAIPQQQYQAALPENQALRESPSADPASNTVNTVTREAPITFTNTSRLSDNKRLDVVNRMRGMQREIQELRGTIEVLRHDLKMMQTQQHNLYRDLDQRLQTISQAKPGERANNSAAQTHAANPIHAIADTGDYHKQFLRQAITTTTNTTTASNSSDENFLTEQSSYRAAYDLIKKRRYTQAAESFQAYLKQYATGSYAPNAHYWLGELALIAGDNDEAKQQFKIVTKEFPKHNKAADATLKLGVMAMEARQWQQARQFLSQVQQQYPISSAAQLAAAKIKHLPQTN